MNPENHDEILRIIAGLIERFTADGRLPPGGSFQGYAIIAGPGGAPAVIRLRQAPELSPEVIEGEGEVFVSAALPAGCDEAPSVAFQPLHVGISTGEGTTLVDLPCPIDPEGCSWQVRNGVLDITCRKVQAGVPDITCRKA